MRRRENPDGSVVTEALRVTYAQDWTNYNAAQCAEGDLFGPMLGRSVLPGFTAPPQGRGRPRLPMSDMAFACVCPVYAGPCRRAASTATCARRRSKGLTDSDPAFQQRASLPALLRNDPRAAEPGGAFRPAFEGRRS